MEDNVYPSGSVYSPFIKEDEVNPLLAQASNNVDLLRELVAYLEKQVAFYSSFDSIPDELNAEPDKFTALSVAHKETARVLRAEKEYVEQLVRQVK